VADACKGLGIKDSGDALRRLHDGDKVRKNLGLRGQAPWLVNESGIYALVLRSSKAEARPINT
jgi:prophage antirepressor-like protein